MLAYPTPAMGGQRTSACTSFRTAAPAASADASSVKAAQVRPDVRTGGQNRQRVAPPGATVSSAVAVCKLRRYTNHGGGPAEGALKSAVIARPVSSTRAGHPAAAQRATIAATTGGSVT